MFIDLVDRPMAWRDVYRLCIGFVTPRPIALVSTLTPQGTPNLAPFSFYNMVCANPPVLMFSTGLHRDRSPKHTRRNIEELPEFVVATVDQSIGPQMVRCAAELPYGESEFAFSGLTPVAATRVRPPLVGEAPVNLECRLRQAISISDGPGGATVIFGDIVAIHVRDDLLAADGTIDPHRLRTVGRLGGAWYSDVTAPYEMQIPKIDAASGN